MTTLRRRQRALVTRLIRVAGTTLTLGALGLILSVIFYVAGLTGAEAWMFISLICLTVGMGCLAGAEGVRRDAGSDYPRRE